MPGVLIAAFEPFGGESINASWEAVRVLGGTDRVETLCLPCAYRRSAELLRAALERVRPGALLLVGQAAGRAEVCVERVAINLDDAELADNDGDIRFDQPIIPSGPPAYFAGVGVRDLVRNLALAGIAARVSHSAGAYVCNHAFYSASHAVAASGTATQVGLVHVPVTPAQAERHPGSPTMPTETVVRALALIINHVLAPGSPAAMAAIASP